MQQIYLWNFTKWLSHSVCIMDVFYTVLSRVVIPASLRLLHQDHFVMQRMKQLAWTATVYWPTINVDAIDFCKMGTKLRVLNIKKQPRKSAVHLGMMPLNPWICVHVTCGSCNQCLCFGMATTKRWCLYKFSFYNSNGINVDNGSSGNCKGRFSLIFCYPHKIFTHNPTTFKLLQRT